MASLPRSSASNHFPTLVVVEDPPSGQRSAVADSITTNGRLWIVCSISLTIHGLFCLLLTQYVTGGFSGDGDIITTASFEQTASEETDLIELSLVEKNDLSHQLQETMQDTAVSALAAALPIPRGLEPAIPDVGLNTAATNPTSPPPTQLPSRTSPMSSSATPKLKFKNRFFDKEFEGDSIVYVLDASSSMQGRRFGRAIAELQTSLKRMKSEQRFFVILYNEQVMPLFDPEPAVELIDVTPSNRNRTIRWLKKQTPQALTDPAPALEMALKLKPSVVVLLTDGELPSGALTAVRQFNNHRSVVHTLAFQSSEGERILRTIASENNGSYRVVR